MRAWSPSKYAACRVCLVQRKVSLLDDSGTCVDRTLCEGLSKMREAIPSIAFDPAVGPDRASLVVLKVIPLPEKP